jgi:class 3 adenylate cyclase
MELPGVERRLAAILAADVVGYSRLMEADEAATHARLKALRKDLIDPAIARHKGRIVKLTGDGALVEFPSAVGAVLAAAEIQRAVAGHEADRPAEERIAFRIGINLGDVIIEDDDIYGDGVNVAARLEALAAPGGICVARNVYNQVKSKVDFGFAAMGEQRVKNISEPVTVYRALLDGARWQPMRRPSATWRHAIVAAAAVLLLIIGSAVWLWDEVDPTMSVAEVKQPLLDPLRVAVLPFVNISPDAENEYFSDGVSEEILNALAKVNEFKVAGRTSSFAFKGRNEDLRLIGQTLDVTHILGAN